MGHSTDTVNSRTGYTPAGLAALVETVTAHPPVRIPMLAFHVKRRAFLEAWHNMLPHLPEDEIDGTINAVAQLAAFARGGRS